MKYTQEKWQKRIRLRSDISSYVTHFTRSTKDMNTLSVLMKILNERRLIGSGKTGFIKGNFSAVCFQDAPVSGLVQNLIHEQYHREELGGKIRYYPCGLMFRKPYVFKKGGRPVIYETKEIADLLYTEESWRVVTFNLNDESNIIDWTHEREWRVKGDFEFELNELYVVLPQEKAYKEFITNVDKEILDNILGIIVLDPVLT